LEAASTETSRVAAPELPTLGDDTGHLAAPEQHASLPRREVIRRRDSLLKRSLGVADMCAVGIALVVGVIGLGDDRLRLTSLAVLPLFVLVFKAMGLYERDEHLVQKATLEEVPMLFGIATLSALLLWLSDGALIGGHLARGQVVAVWLLTFLFTICFRAFARALTRRIVPPERCLLVGDPKAADKVREELSVSNSIRAVLIGAVPATDSWSMEHGANSEPHPNLAAAIEAEQIDRVILTTGPDLGRDDVLYIIRELKAGGVKVSVLPEASRVAGSAVEIDRLPELTLLGVRRFEFSRSSRGIKRIFDVLASGLLLSVLSPLLIAIAVAIRLDSPGPALFRQVRAGRGGRPFQMLKFRSMVDGADRQKEMLRHLNEADGVFKIADDPRITHVGHWLRCSHLDELPQLLNVLRGQMSLVGPRPLPLDEDRAIQGWHRERLEVRPGITGHWQVLGSARIPVKEMVKMDYLYVANWSLWGDVKLLLQTVPVILHRRGL
jgi:exopolysaccharide biosynthesis polyprenyl glycosylphosphotransferase